MGVVFFRTIFVVKNYCVDGIGLSTLHRAIYGAYTVVLYPLSDVLAASVNTEFSKHRDGQIYQPVMNLNCKQNLN